jgi:adrenergic receptor alpha-1D
LKAPSNSATERNLLSIEEPTELVALKMNNSLSSSNIQICIISYQNGLALIVVNLIIAFFGGIGNLLVLMTIFLSRRLRTISVYGIAALSVTDLLTNLAVQPSMAALIYHLMYEDCANITWRVFKTLGFYLCGTSLVVLDYMSVERCLAICYTLWYKRTITPNKAKIALTIVFSMCLFPAISSNFIINSFVVEAYLLLVALVICFTIIVVCYVAMMVRVWKQTAKRKTLQNAQNIQSHSTFQNNKKLAKTVALIIGVFVVYWSPLAFVFANSVKKNPFNSESSAWPVTVGLMSASFNPLIYFYRNNDFRVALKEALMRCRHRSLYRLSPRVHPEVSTV